MAKKVAARADNEGIERIIVAGEPRSVALLRKALPPLVAERIVGEIAGSRHESRDAFVRRAAELLPRAEGQREAEEVDAVLVMAAKGGKAAAGVDATLEAVNRGSVHRLYLLREFRESGGVSAWHAVTWGEVAMSSVDSAASRHVRWTWPRLWPIG